MLKRYYTLLEASEFLARERNEPIAPRDILDLAIRDQVTLCFWFDGQLARFALDDSLKFRVIECIGHYQGYLEIPDADPRAQIFKFSQTSLIEPTEHLPEPMTSISNALNRPSDLPSDILGQYRAIATSGESMHVPFEVPIDEVLVPAVNLLKLRLVDQISDKTSSKETSNLHNIIGALLAEYTMTGSDGPLKQNAVITTLLEHNLGMPGISESNLENVFAKANKIRRDRLG